MPSLASSLGLNILAIEAEATGLKTRKSTQWPPIKVEVIGGCVANYFGGVDIIGPQAQNLAWAHCNVGGFDNDPGIGGLRVETVQLQAPNARHDRPCFMAVRRTFDTDSVRDKIQCRPIPCDSEFIKHLLANSGSGIGRCLPNRGFRKLQKARCNRLEIDS